MFYIIQFIDKNSVALVNGLRVEAGYFLWPRTLVTHVENLVKVGLPPPVKCKTHRVTVHGVLDRLMILSLKYLVATDYDQAIRVQKLFGELSELPPSNATFAFDRYDKRPL